ncbi:MAG TPA: decaprenylphosphoryl-beta-D-ribose oxidase, partial [Acidimicrobiia bacterium]
LADADSQHRYSVAWLDLTRRGKGRGSVMGGDHARSVEAPAGLRDADLAGPTIRIPGATPALVNRVTVNVFNQIWYAKAPRNVSRGVESMGSFIYPLDGLTAWNRLYGDSGFLQYQFVVPYGEESTLVAVAETLVATPTPVSLAVLKRMGDSVGGYLSFPMPGWTLAVDMPLGDPRLGAVLDRCDERVADAGGRVYLAKDSRLRRDIAHEMYPDLAKWREVQAKLDPARRLRSNLSERLELIA